MDQHNPYLDTQFSFNRPAALAQAGVLDASALQVAGSATGHYRATTVRPHVQYFDCDLKFATPLRIHKVLPSSLCIVHVMDGQWQHRIDRKAYAYNPGAPCVLGLSESMEALDQLPAGSSARMAGVRIDGDYLRELAEEDPQLQPLLALLNDGRRFNELPRCQALGGLLERLYYSPYHGTLQRLHQESLSLAVLVELAEHLKGETCAPEPLPRGQRDLAHEARHLLDTHLAEAPDSRALAQQLGVGETTLRRAFASAFGRTMPQYVRQQRLELARNLLRQRKWQVAQVAYQVGYSNPANFSHAYKAYFGHPPGAE